METDLCSPCVPVLPTFVDELPEVLCPCPVETKTVLEIDPPQYKQVFVSCYHDYIESMVRSKRCPPGFQCLG